MYIPYSDSSESPEMLMNSFTFSFKFHTIKDHEFLGNENAENKTLVELCNFKEFF